MPSARPFSSEYSLFFNSHYYLSISLCVSHTLFLSLSLIPSTLPLFLSVSLSHTCLLLSLSAHSLSFLFSLSLHLSLSLSLPLSHTPISHRNTPQPWRCGKAH